MSCVGARCCIRVQGKADEASWQVADPVAARAHLSPKTVNNHLALLTTMVNLAVELGWLARVPKIKKVKAPVCGPEYRYVSGLKHLADVFDAMLGSFERRKMRFARSLKTDRRRTPSVVMRPCCHTMT